MNWRADWQRPVTPSRHFSFRANKGVGRRQSRYILERGRTRPLDHVEQKEIRDGEIVQRRRNGWMLSNTVKSIAEDKARTQVRVIKWLDADVIARAKQALAR